MNESKKKKKDTKRERYIQDRNQMIASEALMIVLINTKVTVVIGKPTQNCKISKPIINILTILFDNGDSIDVDECVTMKLNFIKQDMMEKHFDEKTIFNKMKRIKIHILMEFLIDICNIMGLPISLLLHKTTYYKETVETITIDKTYEGNELIEKGLELNEKINSLIRDSLHDRLELIKNSIQM